MSSVTRGPGDAAPAARDGERGVQYWGPAIAVSLAMFIAVIDSTLMNVAIPAIVADLDTTVSVIQGAIAFYSLVIAALILPGGRLPSIFGIRRLMTITLLVYALGTLLAAVSWNAFVLYLGWSLVEGAAAAVLLPLTFTILVFTYDGRDRTLVLGVLAGVNAAGAAVGPILGGTLTTYASWRWGFALEALVVLVTLVFVRYVPADRLTETRGSLDLGGTVLSVVGATALVGGFILGGKYGWLVASRPFVVAGVQVTPFGTSPAIWCIGSGLLAFAAFVEYERRQEAAGRSPLVPMAVLTNRPFTSGVLTFSVRSIVMAGFIFVIPVYLQSGLGYTAFDAGLAMLPFSVATLLASMLTTGWRARVPAKTLIQVGIVLMGLGLALLYGQTGLDQTVTGMAVPMTVFGLGLGLLMAQLVDVTLSSVPRRDAAEASVVMNATGMLGYALGTAIVGSFLLEQFYGGVVDGVLRVRDVAVSAEQRAGLVQALETAAETATEETQRAFIEGLSSAEGDLLVEVFGSAIVDAQQATLLLLTLLVLLTLVVSSFLPGGTPETEPAPGTVDASPGEVTDAGETAVEN